MALKKKKEQKEQATEKVNFDIKVLRAKQLDSGSVSFDMDVNGIAIYGCFAKTEKSNTTGEDVDVVNLPQYKGSNGKYYNHVWFPFSLDDKENIINQINSLLG